MLIPCDEVNILNTFRVMIILRLLLLLTNLHLKLLSTQGTGADKLLSTQRVNQEKLEMVQRRAARFVKSRYRRTDSVTAMLDELGWPILSKRRKDTRLILFYKTINNLAQVTHEHILTKAYEGTRKKNNHKFRHIAVNTSQYIGSHFPPKLSVYGISCHSLIPLL